MPVEEPAMQAAPEAAAPEAGTQGMDAQLQQVAGQLLDMLMQQIGDPQIVAAVLEMALEMLNQAAAAPAEQPAFQRMGGKIVRIR